MSIDHEEIVEKAMRKVIGDDLHGEEFYNMDMLEAHDVIDIAEKRVKSVLGCDISIHMDPVVTDDEQINELRELTERVIKEIEPSLNMHDFRVVKGPMLTNLIFDVLVPYNFCLSDEQLKKKINAAIREEKENCFAVINIDKSMVR